MVSYIGATHGRLNIVTGFYATTLITVVLFGTYPQYQFKRHFSPFLLLIRNG